MMGILQKLIVKSSLRALTPLHQTIDCVSFSAGMGYRYVAYICGDRGIRLQIEPMVRGPDIVYVPDEIGWQKSAPTWGKPFRTNVVMSLQGVQWNRELDWRETTGAEVVEFVGEDLPVIPGTLESTAGGRELE